MAKALIVQTAFIGDVVLTLPLASALRSAGFEPEFLVVPRTAELPASHPDVCGVLAYDKRGRDRGLPGLLRTAGRLRRRFDLAVLPHRSLRSALLALLGGIPGRIGFSSSPFRFLYTASVPYGQEAHEVLRNLSLLSPIGVSSPPPEPPWLIPGRGHEEVALSFLREHELEGRPTVALAPGSVWPTKRWVPEGFRRVAEALVRMGVGVVLVGGAEDRELCERIVRGLSPEPAVAAGRTSVMESAALLKFCSVLVSNDSAPVHIASAVGTPVVAIFGPTVPAFGFGPYGPGHRVVELDLPCRPCSVHGGRRCPEGHFMCMRGITAEMVLKEVSARLDVERRR
ncbi:MAG TPA: glycosyltransferase family 9 protein [Candidatus Latescibacteria bacterium]|nr:glycosyltransferase family 9 protein [Candidatus Latescibacterota bacterium]